MRILTFTIMSLLFLILLITTSVKAAPLAIYNVYIEPTGYEDPSTHEWKGSFWIVTALADTNESFLFCKFNETEAGLYGQNKIGDKTIVPTATIKITITPEKPYWEISLKNQTYMVYPTTYGTDIKVLTKETWKVNEYSVPALNVTVLESYGYWTKHTPFYITVEKLGAKSFTKTIRMDTVGGAENAVITNPADSSEKLMVTNLGQLDTGYSSPRFSLMTIFNNNDKIIVFDGENVRQAIQYGRDLTTGEITYDKCYAFYWFGGGNTFRTVQGYEVQYWPDDKSPAHFIVRQDPVLGKKYNSPVEEYDFPGSYRADYFDKWGFGIYRVLPIQASIFDNNPSTNPSPGKSLVSFLNESVSHEITRDLDLWKAGYEILNVGDSKKLRVYMPTGATSSLITIRISSELVDSIVYQPIVANGKVEQAFWDSTKATNSAIMDRDVAVLKIKQCASQSSKITVTPSIPANVPVSISPFMDSAIVDPNAVHTFQFEIRNLGTQINQSSTITFTITNDLGTVTDTIALNFDLIANQNNQQNAPPENITDEGDPLWIWLIIVISITVATATLYGVYTHRSSQKATSNKNKRR